MSGLDAAINEMEGLLEEYRALLHEREDGPRDTFESLMLGLLYELMKGIRASSVLLDEHSLSLAALIGELSRVGAMDFEVYNRLRSELSAAHRSKLRSDRASEN